jgi:hypothetical protein
MSFSRIFRIFAFVAISLGSISVFAQKFSLGLKAGVLGAYTNFSDRRDTLKSNVKLGFNVGGLIMFPLKNRYSFMAEGGYSQQGRSWTYKPNDARWTSTYYFADLSMALRRDFRLKILKNVPSKWFFTVGPNINYWIGGRGKFIPHQGPGSPAGLTQNLQIVFDKPPSTAYQTLYINNENRWLWGVNLGVGVTFTTLKNQRILTELRMTWGQTYLGDKKSESLYNLTAADNMDLKCNLKVLNLSVAYIFERDIQKGRMGKSTKKVK